MYLTESVRQRSAAQPRVIGLDLLRIVAALAVMLFHFGYQISEAGHTPYRVSGGAIRFPELVDYAQYGWIGVQSFFVISGFVIAVTAVSGDPARFLASRILRLAPAVWICAPITAIVAVIAGDGSVFRILKRLLASMTFFPFSSQIDGSYWTLSIEIAFYLAVFLLLWRNRFGYFGHYVRAIAVISAAFNLAMFAGCDDVNFSNRYTNLLLFRHGCEFAFGAIVYQINQQGYSPRAGLFLCVAVIGSYAQILPPFGSADYWPLYSMWSTFLLSFLFAVAANGFLLRLCNDAALRGLRFLGEATYPFYLIHQLVGAWFIGILIAAGVGDYASLAIAIGAVLLLAGVISIFEKRVREAIRPAVLRRCSRLTVPGQPVPNGVAANLPRHERV